MKGSSRRTSQNKNVQTILIVGVLVVCVLLLMPKIFAFGASLILSPLHAGKTWFAESTASFPYYLRERAALDEQIHNLQQKVATQGGLNYQLSVLQEENEQLRSLLGDDSSEKKVVAGVIGRPADLPYDVLIIDKGSQDGVVENAPVFVGDRSVIGAVKKVYMQSAIVELLTSPNFVTSVYILGPNIYTNAVGVGGGVMRVGVPQGINLQSGDTVILPSILSGVYGQISVVESVPSRPEQYGYVAPDVPLQSIRLVAVGTTAMNTVSFEEAQRIVAENTTTAFEVPVPDDILIQTDAQATTSTSSVPANASTSPDDL